MQTINFPRFNDLYERVPPQDFHIHTDITDGKSTIEEHIESAVQKGLEDIAFTEHVRRDSDWFDSFVSKVETLRENRDLNIYYGIEAKAIDFDGHIDATPNMVEKSEIILGAVHRYPGKEEEFINIAATTGENAAKIEFELALGLLKHGEINVLAHPGGFFEKFFPSSFPGDYLREVFKESIKRKIAVEFNSRYMKDVSAYLDIFRETNPFISLGSDAHGAEELGSSADLIKKSLGMKK